jgi:hypothetical protein
MRDAITVAFEVFWLLTLVLAVAVGLMGRSTGGRRLLQRWIRFPTFVWCEAVGKLNPSADSAAIEETLDRLRASLPMSKRSLVPRFVTVQILESETGTSGERVVTMRAATLLQTKTTGEASERLAAALGGVKAEQPEHESQ